MSKEQWAVSSEQKILEAPFSSSGDALQLGAEARLTKSSSQASQDEFIPNAFR